MPSLGRDQIDDLNEVHAAHGQIRILVQLLCSWDKSLNIGRCCCEFFSKFTPFVHHDALMSYGSYGQMWRSELWGKFATGNFQYSSSYLNYTVPCVLLPWDIPLCPLQVQKTWIVAFFRTKDINEAISPSFNLEKDCGYYFLSICVDSAA